MSDKLQQWHGGIIDETLTKEGIAAGAKAVGDALGVLDTSIGSLKDQIDEINSTTVDDVTSELAWEQGSIRASNGADNTSNQISVRIRTRFSTAGSNILNLYIGINGITGQLVELILLKSKHKRS